MGDCTPLAEADFREVDSFSFGGRGRFSLPLASITVQERDFLRKKLFLRSGFRHLTTNQRESDIILLDHLTRHNSKSAPITLHLTVHSTSHRVLAMDLSNFSSRKRPRSCRRPMSSLDLDQREGATPKDTTDSNAAVTRMRGHAGSNYRSAVCLSVLLVQLARVQSWSPSFSIAKKAAPSTFGIPKDSTDAAFWASFADQPTIPSSELFSSRYLVAAKKDNNKNQWTMAASGSPPSMLLPNDFFFPVSSKSLATSESVRKGIESGNSLQAASENEKEGRVLGFDVFELQATRSDDLQQPIQQNSSDFMPGLTWQNAPLPNTANDNLEAAAAASAAAAAITQPRVNNNGGVKLVKFLPAWFPWVPTKSQIMTLKLKELKEACSQRGLTKVRWNNMTPPILRF